MDIDSVRKLLRPDAEQPQQKLIAFVAMEGWSQKGGQGDYVRELSKALAERGQRVVVINPWFTHPFADLSADDGEWLFDVEVPVGGGVMEFSVHYNLVGPVHYLRFRDAQGLLFPEVYPPGQIHDEAYPDSPYGYVEAVVLSRIPMHILARLEAAPDVLHFNDWQAALGPVYLQYVYRSHPRYAPWFAITGSVIIVHNMAYQGVFGGSAVLPKDDPLVREMEQRWIIPNGFGYFTDDGAVLDLFSLNRLPGDLQTAGEGGLEYWSNLEPGRHNLLKGGLETADYIVAVSKGNAAEIQTANLGFGLGGVIARRAAEGRVDAVYNGLDADAYRPNRLEELQEIVDAGRGLAFTAFDADSPDLLQRRGLNKAALKAKVNRLVQTDPGRDLAHRTCVGGLDESARGDLLVVSVTRLVRQKGLDTLLLPLDAHPGLGIGQGDRLIDVLLRLRGPRGERFQFLLLGTAGDSDGEAVVAATREFAGRQEQAGAGQFAAVFSFDRRLANQIRCAADLFFMPSQYEPGGVANIQAAVVGDLCVLTRTGGLVDFVEAGGTHPDFTAAPFDYDDPASVQQSALELAQAFEAALALYTSDRTDWEAWVRQAMRFQGDWSARVDQYLDIYGRCVALRQ